MKADFVNPFLLSLLNVLPPWHSSSSPGKPKRKMDELARGDVSGPSAWSARRPVARSHQLREGLALEIMRRMLARPGHHQ